MKNIVKIFSFAAALAVAFSCSDLNDYPAFEDSKSFAAFDVTSVSVDENAGTVSIPVTIASVDPKQVALAYNTADGTAKKDVNFKLADESAVLAFDGKTRSMEIVINIVDLAGEYTGDLNFTVSLVKPGNLDLGANSTCTVKISDLDHPLAAILGNYTVSAFDYFGGADAQWAAKFEKDESDVTVVWISGITSSTGTDAVYGNVTIDEETGEFATITIPFGQTIVWNASYNAILVGFKDGGYYAPEGNIVLEKTENGWVNADPEWGWGWLAVSVSSGSIAGWTEAYMPGGVFTKN